jgi:hypothetical protein
MNAASNTLSYFNIIVNDNHTMAVSNYTIQHKLPVDIIQQYGNTSSYVINGITMALTLPNDFSCYSYNSINNKGCMVSG